MPGKGLPQRFEGCITTPVNPHCSDAATQSEGHGGAVRFQQYLIRMLTNLSKFSTVLTSKQQQ